MLSSLFPDYGEKTELNISNVTQWLTGSRYVFAMTISIADGNLRCSQKKTLITVQKSASVTGIIVKKEM